MARKTPTQRYVTTRGKRVTKTAIARGDVTLGSKIKRVGSHGKPKLLSNVAPVFDTFKQEVSSDPEILSRLRFLESRGLHTASRQLQRSAIKQPAETRRFARQMNLVVERFNEGRIIRDDIGRARFMIPSQSLSAISRDWFAVS